MTTANKITLVRILLVPFFIVQVLYYVRQGEEWHRWLAIGSFLLAVVSDGLDGYVARRFHQQSELGALLDPVADKFLLVSGVILLGGPTAIDLPRFPLWYTGTVLGRDVVLIGGSAVLHFLSVRVRVQPVLLGKIATVLQMFAILWALLKWPPVAGNGLLVLGALATAGSGLMYLRDGLRQASASPSSNPRGS